LCWKLEGWREPLSDGWEWEESGKGGSKVEGQTPPHHRWLLLLNQAPSATSSSHNQQQKQKQQTAQLALFNFGD
jgi:hypothetical protein